MSRVVMWSLVLHLLLGSSVIAGIAVRGDITSGCEQEMVRLRKQVGRFERMVKEQQLQIVALQSQTSKPRSLPVKPFETPEYTDCSEVFNAGYQQSGFYRLRPLLASNVVLRYCDMSDGGGWTVFQQRTDGSIEFNRSWEEYKMGFGNFEAHDGEFWLGNDIIHQITSQGTYILQIDLADWNGEKRFAQYQNFRIADEKKNYQLSFGEYNGTAGDSLSGGFHPEVRWWSDHLGMAFSTWDRDNDRYVEGHCANEDKGGWWFNRCHAANLNGQYYPGGVYSSRTDDGIVWYTWHGYWYSLRFSRMKIRPESFLQIISQ
uniref:fibrinogen-like protein 1 n=1 Tax=Myxine glutinosa TaxID=7769 RepID=UPI00358E5D3B